MTRNPYRDRNVIAWCSSALTSYTIVVGVLVVAVIHDPVTWIPWALLAGVGWLLLAVYCCVLIEEAARRQRRARIIVPDAQMRWGRLPAAVHAERDIPFGEHLDDPLAVIDVPEEPIEPSWVHAILAETEPQYLRRVA